MCSGLLLCGFAALLSVAASENCTASLLACQGELRNLTQEFSELQAAYDSCGCGSDPCSSSGPLSFDRALHIGAVIIILAASIFGTLLPLTGKYVPLLKVHPFAIVLGKCVGIGIILACALIHMLQPAAVSFSNTACLPTMLSDYGAYAYLFSLLAAIVMHYLDYVFSRFTEGECHEGHGHSHATVVFDTMAQTPKEDMKKQRKKIVEAYMLEFGMTVHSIFIGLAVGVVEDDELRGLLVALCFHQFFEGIALGSRIADACLPTHWHEAILSIVFSVAAPVGVAIGVALTSSLNPNGQTYLVVQGIFDSICAGILLYIGFTLLLGDFHCDIEAHCKGKKHEAVLRAAIFAALWVGAGVMAFLGKLL